MSHRYNLKAVERRFCDVIRSTLSFGGKSVLLIGDSRQIRPVLRAGNRTQTVGATLERWLLYPLFTVLHLCESMRLSALRRDASADEDALTFPSFLLDDGEGKLQAFSASLISLPKSFSVCDDTQKLIDFVFTNLRGKHCDEIWLSVRAVLTTRNASLEALINFVGDMILGNAKQFLSAGKVDNPDENELQYTVELLNSIQGTASLPDHLVSL